MSCTEDPRVEGLGYGTRADERHSPWRLRMPTLADELRIQLDGTPRVVTLSLKARSAVMLAGRRADATAWMSEDGGWMTSTAYGEGRVGAIEEFIETHRVEGDLGRTWTKLLPAAAYLYDEDQTGVRPPTGWTAGWPHAIGHPGAPADKAFFEVWKESPFSDSYLARLTVHLVDRLDLGRDEVPDFLGVSFSALDLAGHDFGPRSHEVQDLLAQLDRALGDLFDHLDARVGADRYVVALTADHGVGPVPEQIASRGLDAGRVRTSAVVKQVDAALTPILGTGPHVAAMEYTDLYFLDGVYDRLRTDPRAMAAALEAVASTPGVWRVFRGDELAARADGGDRLARIAARGYDPARSGDLVVVPRPYWIMSSSTATHGTGHDYDRRVPLILMGSSITPGGYLDPSSPADIAPTLAFLSGVTLPHAEGRVLREALARVPTVGPIRSSAPASPAQPGEPQ
jgi:hypothetical protein